MKQFKVTQTYLVTAASLEAAKKKVSTTVSTFDKLLPLKGKHARIEVSAKYVQDWDMPGDTKLVFQGFINKLGKGAYVSVELDGTLYQKLGRELEEIDDANFKVKSKSDIKVIPAPNNKKIWPDDLIIK